MVDVIITVVMPAKQVGSNDIQDQEPAHTKVYRFEFEDENAIEASLGWLRSQAVAGGRMENV